MNSTFNTTTILNSNKSYSTLMTIYISHSSSALSSLSINFELKVYNRNKLYI